MVGPLRYARRLFDALDNATSDETAQHGVYAGTRSSQGVYAIANTQSAESTYRTERRAATDKLGGDGVAVDVQPVELLAVYTAGRMTAFST